VQVPYEDTTLPGYLLRPDDTGAARPTLVMTNGSDESLPGLLGNGAAEALARGWNAFVFDGPGQQSMLFERGVPFRYDWEAVLTPVIDALVARPDVDASALTGYGVSQGGYWITRAVAFEKRMVAAVADPGVVDVSAGWTAHLPPALLDLLNSGQKDAFNAAMAKAQADASPEAARTLAFRSKPYGLTDPFDLFTEVRKYQVRDVAAGSPRHCWSWTRTTSSSSPASRVSCMTCCRGRRRSSSSARRRARTSTASPPDAS
jgi:hypothetical protein